MQKILYLHLDPLVEVDVSGSMQVWDKLHQVVGGVGCLAATFQFTFQVPGEELFSDILYTINVEPVYESGDFIS